MKISELAAIIFKKNDATLNAECQGILQIKAC